MMSLINAIVIVRFQLEMKEFRSESVKTEEIYTKKKKIKKYEIHHTQKFTTPIFYVFSVFSH